MTESEQTLLFLSTLGSPPYIFQTFTDNKEQRSLTVKDPLARVLIGTFEEHSAQLNALSSKGAGVFVQINAGRERGKGAVTQIRALFVDIDAPERTDETLAVISKHMPKPSMLVNSSSKKFHLYWLLNDCPIEKFGMYQKHLANRFCTDSSMFNLDRVMRLPGFIHQKRDKYQVNARFYNVRYQAREIEEYLSNIPVDLITPFIIPAAPGRIPPPPPKSDNPFGIDMADYEPPTVLAPGERTTKMVQHIGWLVQQGYDEPHIRDEIIKMNVELCPAGSAPSPPGTLEGEVLGCISKFIAKREKEIASTHGDAFAKATQVSDILPPPPPPPAIKALLDEPELPKDTLVAWLARFIYIVDKKRVADTTAHGEWAILTWEEFEKQHTGIKVSKGLKLATAWLNAKERLTVRGVAYKPCADAIIKDPSDHKFFNSYQPPEIAPAYKCNFDKISVFLEHITYLFPRPNDRDAFLGWFCATVTNPLMLVTWCPVLVSKQGSGKGWILDVMKMLMGPSNVKPITPDRIDNQFNSFLFGSTLVCIYDMHKSKNRQLDGKLKGYIDVTETEANKKQTGERTERVYANFLIFSNTSDAVYVEPGDRRFWMVELADPREPSYYDKLYAWLEEESNLPHLLAWCQDYQSKMFSPTHPPMSPLKLDVMNRNKSEIQLELESVIEERLGPFACDVMSFDCVKQYMEMVLDMDIKGAARVTLSQVWGTVSHPIAVERVEITVGRKTTRQRIRCVRNLAKWNKKASRAIGEEASRAIQIVLKPESAKPKLEAVKNE